MLVAEAEEQRRQAEAAARDSQSQMDESNMDITRDEGASFCDDDSFTFSMVD